MICPGGYGSSSVLARETPGGLAVASTVECPENPTYLAARVRVPTRLGEPLVMPGPAGVLSL